MKTVTYQVYVVELESTLCSARGCPAENGLPPVYVGQSVHSPEVRFRQHREGYKSSKYVRGHGIRLLPSLSERLRPSTTRTDAIVAEAELANQLRAEGYCVFGGH